MLCRDQRILTLCTMSLSAEAEKRKDRLLALKKRKRGQLDEPEAEPSIPTHSESPPQNGDTKALQSQTNSKPYSPPSPTTKLTKSLPLSGRNYDPSTRTTKLGFQENPLANLPETFETVEEVAINLAIEAITEGDRGKNKDVSEVDLFSLQPKRPNWDLKRDLEKKLERLKPRTDRAIAKLVRERLVEEKRKGGAAAAADAVGEGDLAMMVEMREQHEREERI